MIFWFDLGPHLKGYWPWLIGGGLYFPLLFLTTKFKQGDFFKDLTLKRELILILASLLEWGFAALFFIFIGEQLGIHANYLRCLSVVFYRIGIRDHLYGARGLGSFDVFMMIGLLPFGVTTEQAVIWLLFFRLFYYIIPFGIGLSFFVHYAGSQVNHKLNGIPKLIFAKDGPYVIDRFLYVSGILLLLEATIPNWAYSNSFLAKLYPYTFLFINQLTDIVFAFALIGMARGIEAKVKKHIGRP